MEVKKIKTANDIEIYIEGCLNDYDLKISTKQETISHLTVLVATIYNKTKETYAERLYDGLKGNEHE